MSGSSQGTRVWRPISEDANHDLFFTNGREVGDGVFLRIELGPTSKVGSSNFRVFLDSRDLGQSHFPVVMGLQNSGKFPGFNWLEITFFMDMLDFDQGQVKVPESIDLNIIAALSEIVPSGGHLMVEYDSIRRKTTARALAAGVPPIITPLGSMMFSIGCGVAFKDWYISEGGREGPRKLQGFKAIDAHHERVRFGQSLDLIEECMSSFQDLDWDLQILIRPLADATITLLRSKLEIPHGPIARP